MASAHLHASIGSRGKGHSAVAASAYRARAEMVDERTGLQHDYSRHRNHCLFSGIFAPKDAPEWTRDGARLWNHVEAFEKHQKAELYREVEIALPHELTPKENWWLLQDWIKDNVTRKGLICEAFIHEPPRQGDGRNIHAHVMIVTRRLDGSEFQRSKDKFDSYAAKQAHWAEALKAERASWEKHANRHLERHGHEARIDMSRQAAEPTVHLGKHATALERMGVQTELGDINRAVEALNERRRAANENEAAPRIAEWLEDRAAEQLETLSRLAADEILEPEAGHQVADLDAALRAQIRALEATDPERFRQIMGAYAPAHFAEWLKEREAQPQAQGLETPATTLAEPSPEATQRPSYEVENEPEGHDRAKNQPEASQHAQEAAARAAPEVEAERPAPAPEATHAPENEPHEAAPARPSYLPETVIPMGYSPPREGYRDEAPEAEPEPSRGMVEPVSEREVPEIRPRPGMIFIGKCLEWGIQMASRIVDAIASIFETRDERRREPPRQLPPPAKPRDAADDMIAAALEYQRRRPKPPPEPVREAIDRLRELLPDNDPKHPHRGNRR